MATYAVFRTHRFEKEFLKQLSSAEQEEVRTVEQKKLTENPYVGDPLGYKFLREKKIGGKRIYFLVYEDLKAVLIVAISDKKTQQETIDTIHKHLREYHQVIQDAITQHDEFDHA